MKKITTILGLFLFIIITTFSFNIDTTLFDQRIDTEDGYKEIKLTNEYSENIRYKIKVLKSTKKNKDMSSWVKISPTVLNIPPFSEKVLKIFAKSPNESKVGEYTFNLQIEPIIVPTISKAKEGKIKGSSNVAIVPIIKMHGYVGNPEFEKNINLENIKLKKINREYTLTGTLINKAYAGKNIGFNFIGENDFIVDGKWIGRVYPT